MKSFRDRNPYVVGMVSAALIAVVVLGAFLYGLLQPLDKVYSVKAVFTDASGISKGAVVRVAGVKAGLVTGVQADREVGNVIVTLDVNRERQAVGHRHAGRDLAGHPAGGQVRATVGQGAMRRTSRMWRATGASSRSSARARRSTCSS